jgi:hypothetical protein
MTKSILLSIALMFVFTFTKAQTVMQLKGVDCNGASHDLMVDLDAGKAVLLHFFMPSCGSCIPPAQKIQKMANGILATHPGMITAYAMPYNNSTTCSYASTWCSSNALSLYTPYDSGATQVANYGGFGMPTVVLLGGKDHKVLFSTQSFSTSDTTIMRNAIMNLLNGTTGVADLQNSISAFKIYPNPTADIVSINVELKVSSNLLIDVIDITGKQVAVISNEKQNMGGFTKQFNTAILPNGNYFVRLNMNGKTNTQKLFVSH